MNWNASSTRKVAYICTIAVLLVPLYFLGNPATVKSGGGELAQIKKRSGLSQSQLGEIDPTSETMKLATLGLRGVASTLLWQKAFEYKKTKRWDLLTMTNQQIAHLQPNFVSIWEFQAHNLSYNISVEFDDYKYRYRWVKKGIYFLQKGTDHNRNNPRLLWQLGWFTGQKIGVSDEKREFRELYRGDTDFHDDMQRDINIDLAKGYLDETNTRRPDNWLTAKLWYKQGQDVIKNANNEDIPLINLVEIGTSDQYKLYQGKSPLVYHQNSYQQKINYAKAISREGILNDDHISAWRNGRDDWVEFGLENIPTSWGTTIHLGDKDRYTSKLREINENLAALDNGLRDTLREEAYAALSEAERTAFEMPPEKWNQTHYRNAMVAERKLAFDPEKFIDRVEPDLKAKARQVTRELAETKEMLRQIERYREQANYDYWMLRCETERLKKSTDARKAILDAEKAYEKGNIDEAREKFEEAWALLRLVYDESKLLEFDQLNEVYKDGVTGADMKDSINHYREVLLQFDEEFDPQKFPIPELIRSNYPDEFEWDDDGNLITSDEGETTSTDPADSASPDEPTESTQPETEDDGAVPPEPKMTTVETSATSSKGPVPPEPKIADDVSDNDDGDADKPEN